MFPIVSPLGAWMPRAQALSGCLWQASAETLLSLSEEVEAKLAAAYPLQNAVDLATGGMLNMCHLMHMLLLIAKKSLGDDWAAKLAIADASSEQRMEVLTLYGQAVGYIVAILHSANHWALAAYSKASKQLVMYDGRTDQVTSDQAYSFGLHLGMPAETPVCRCDLPQQLDAWSCGHRALIAFAQICRAAASQTFLPTSLREGCFSKKNINSIVDFWNVSMATMRQGQARESSSPGTKRLQADVVDSQADCFEQTPSPKKRRLSRHDDGTTMKKHSATKLEKPMGAKSKDVNLRDKQCGEARAVAHGIDHQVVFQKEHNAAQMRVRAGHWAEFCCSIIDGRALSCSVCEQLRSKALSRDSQEEPEEPIAKADPDDKDVKEHIDDWLVRNRPGVYKKLPPEVGKKYPYYCNLCRCPLQFFRAYDREYVFIHERRKKHIHALMTSNTAPMDTAQHQKCSGVFISDERFEIHKVQHSARNWLDAGQPRFRNAAAQFDELDLATFRTEKDGAIVMKHRDCTGETAWGKTHCVSCIDLARNTKLLKTLAKWSYDIDLCALSRQLARGHDHGMQYVEKMRHSDYAFHVQAELRALACPSKTAQQKQQKIVERFASIPHHKRSTALQKLIELYLAKPTQYHSSDVEAQAHHSLAESMSEALQGEERLVMNCAKASGCRIADLPDC